jgi:hypothetical protein
VFLHFSYSAPVRVCCVDVSVVAARETTDCLVLVFMSDDDTVRGVPVVFVVLRFIEMLVAVRVFVFFAPRATVVFVPVRGTSVVVRGVLSRRTLVATRD